MTDMLATTLRQIEEAPQTHWLPPTDLSPEAQSVDFALVWRRIEAYTAWRSTKRGCEFIVEGPGSWRCPLFPATVVATSIWTPAVNGWSAIDDIPLGPLGTLWLSGAGPFRLTCEVGDNEALCPPLIAEAYRRLAEYFASDRALDDSGARLGPTTSRAGASHEVASVGPIREEFHRSPEWLARAMQQSGAADLLRQFRKTP